jgi:hypothetical protein
LVDDTRRASLTYALAGTGGSGAGDQAGSGEAVIGDDGLSVGPVSVSFLDADQLRATNYRIEIDCWPAGRLTLEQLGRRYDTFLRELSRARDQARVRGLLAHGVTMPLTFAGALLDHGVRPAEFQIYDTHVTVVPGEADPYQIPLGALTEVTAVDDPPGVLLVAGSSRTLVGQLARQRDALLHAVTERRHAQARLLSEQTGLSGFADGRAVPRPEVPGFDDLVRRFTAPDRAACAGQLLAAVRGSEPRLGFVQLLDPDSESEAGETVLPKPWASFLLVPAGAVVAFEILAGPSAATYVFEGDAAVVGVHLQALHARRAPLALSDAEARLTLGNPYRLALRRLESLRWLRAATRARLVHNDGWTAELQRAVA